MEFGRLLQTWGEKMIDWTKLSKLIHDFQMCSGKKPEQILMSRYMQDRLNEHALSCNMFIPVYSFDDVLIRTSPIVPQDVIYVGQMFLDQPEKEL